jgi:tRNA(fMet)-specific endonuclease VapC
MLSYLLDTNICSFAIMGHPKAFARLADLDNTQWCISSIVLAELQYGLTKGKLSPGSKNALELFLRMAAVVPFDSKAARSASQVRFDLERIGKAAGAVDQLIAGHAISLGLVLVTDNLKHFENVPGLKLENWV